jgi:hypothetical protein
LFTENVDAAEAIFGGAHGALARGGVRDVEGHRERRLRRLRNYRFDLRTGCAPVTTHG